MLTKEKVIKTDSALVKIYKDSKIKKGKMPLLISLKIDRLALENHDRLCEVAKTCKLNKVQVKNVFAMRDDLRKFLHSLSQNTDSKRLHLDISHNGYNHDCTKLLQHMILKEMISTLILPSELPEDDIECILFTISENKVELQYLCIQYCILTENSFGHLESILKSKKIKNELDMTGCKNPQGPLTDSQRKSLVKIGGKGFLTGIKRPAIKQVAIWQDGGTRFPWISENDGEDDDEIILQDPRPQLVEILHDSRHETVLLSEETDPGLIEVPNISEELARKLKDQIILHDTSDDEPLNQLHAPSMDEDVSSLPEVKHFEEDLKNEILVDDLSFQKRPPIAAQVAVTDQAPAYIFNASILFKVFCLVFLMTALILFYFN